MINRVPITPELLRWARNRSGRDVVSLSKPFPKLEAWERGELQPTLKQLERYAKATRTPIGYFFLEKPPEEQVPIPDLRTMANEYYDRPSPDLLDTIYICQQRQEWYRDYSRSMGSEPLSFVGSIGLETDEVHAAADLRAMLHFNIEERRQIPTWTEALRHFISQADSIGVLVMVSGVVGNNNHRKLDPKEFRGFALADDFAPVVFINGADTKSAQMFTLAHELAHIWLGRSAVSDTQALSVPDHEVERWCNRVAAELLVPLSIIQEEFRAMEDLRLEQERLARHFKVSTLVILRRIYDAGGLTNDEFQSAYEDELERLLAMPKASGGSFYLTQPARVSRRFAQAIVISTLEGHTLYRDALRMLGFSKQATFRELGHSLEVL